MKLTARAVAHASRLGGGAAWPISRCNEVLFAFKADWVTAKPLEIYRFISDASSFARVLKGSPRSTPKSVKRELEAALKATAALTKRLESFSNSAEQAFVLGASGAIRHKPVETDHPFLTAVINRGYPGAVPVYPDVPKVHEERVFLGSAAEQLKVLQAKLQTALAVHKVSRTDRLDVTNATDLARFLCRYWTIAFRKRPDVTPGRRFHDVVEAIAPVYGLRVGSKVIRKAAKE